MSGWKNALTEQQIWQVVTFLKHMDSLPPAAKQVFADAQPGTFPFASAAAATPAAVSQAKPHRNPHK